MRLDLRFTARPIEEVWCEIIVAFVFEGSLEKWDDAFGIDLKTSGYLTSLKKKGFWNGGNGDTLLVASQGMLKSDRILLKGLGARGDFTPGLLSERISEAGTAVDKLAVRDIGIRIPTAPAGARDHTSLLEAACELLVEPFINKHAEDPDFSLKIVFSVNADDLDALKSRVHTLKQRFESILDHTIVFDTSYS